MFLKRNKQTKLVKIINCHQDSFRSEKSYIPSSSAISKMTFENPGNLIKSGIFMVSSIQIDSY